MLIVDDSPVVLAVLEAVFLAEHYLVVTASDGQRGFEQALRTRPDLLVTDSVMPEVDGLEFLRLLKNHPDTKGIPVIMLTSGDVLGGGSGGDHPRPDAYAAKGAPMQDLIILARSLVSVHRTP